MLTTRLPSAYGLWPLAGDEAPMKAPSAMTTALILNVDDNEAGLYAKTRVLRRAGHTVIEAGSGRETLEQMSVHRPDLVILDVHLPDVDGRDLCAQIKSRREFAGTLVLQTSATFVETQDRVAGLERGADMYLVEPVEPTELLAVVGALLRMLAAERSLRASERRYRTLAQGAPVGIFHTDAAGQWLYANERWRSMAGWQEGETGRSDWLSAVHPDDRQRIDALWRAAVKAGTHFGAEHRLLPPDASSLWVWTQALPERDDAGGLAGYVGSVTDITERKQGEVLLKEADRHKDEFLAMLAHELRNPLQPISNAVQLLGIRKADDALVGQAHAILGRQLSHLTRLVDDLLDVSRITRGQIRLQKQPVQLGEVIESALESVRPLIDARGHALRVSAPGEPPLLLHADFTRLVQVLLNLLSNAAKYTPEGGEISLEAAREGHEVVIRIRDNGSGIAPELLPRVFDLFTQASPSLDRGDGGLGIGLTLVRRLTELHGGTVEAFSRGVGAGTECVVRLPLLHGGSEPADSPREAQPGAAGEIRGQRILVVDDNRDAAESLKLLLRLCGHDASAAHDGPEALALARALRPSLVLLDIGLPGMDGYELARRLREEPLHKDARLVAMTGYGQMTDRERSSGAGFFAHLVKPVSLEALNALLARTASR
jgi:PAS domain S-box-containing protein